MAKIYLVVFINVVFVIVFGVCFHIAGSQDGDWAENFWKGFTFASDAADTVSEEHLPPQRSFPLWSLLFLEMSREEKRGVES